MRCGREQEKRGPKQRRGKKKRKKEKEKEKEKKDEWWDCPICNRPQPADERLLNEHIDLCLSRQTIRDAVQGDYSTTSRSGSPAAGPGTVDAKRPKIAAAAAAGDKKKKGRPSSSTRRPSASSDPRQKKLFFG